MPHAELPADVVQQAQHIRLVGVQALAPGGNALGAMGRDAAMVPPGAGIALFSFLQQLLSGLSQRQHNTLLRAQALA